MGFHSRTIQGKSRKLVCGLAWFMRSLEPALLYDSSVDLSRVRSVNEVFSVLLRLSYNE